MAAGNSVRRRPKIAKAAVSDHGGQRPPRQSNEALSAEAGKC